jgi:hypothetical protein
VAKVQTAYKAKCTHAREARARVLAQNIYCGQMLTTFMSGASYVENLSFQHFQQVFNTKVHNKIRHNDELSTIQQVFNKIFNRQKSNK